MLSNQNIINLQLWWCILRWILLCLEFTMPTASGATNPDLCAKQPIFNRLVWIAKVPPYSSPQSSTLALTGGLTLFYMGFSRFLITWGGGWYTPPAYYCSLLISGRPKWTNFSWHHYFKHLKGPGHVIFWKFFKNFKNFGRRMILVKIWQKKWKLKNFELQTCLIPQMKAENM